MIIRRVNNVYTAEHNNDNDIASCIRTKEARVFFFFLKNFNRTNVTKITVDPADAVD